MPEQAIKPGWFTALGILMIVVGFIVIGTPLMMTIAMNIFIGWMLVFIGAAEVVHAFSSQEWGGFLWQLLIGALTTLAGLVLVFYPMAGAVTLTLVLAIWLIVSGLMKVIMGFKLRPEPGSGVIIFGGALALLLGIVIYAEWPYSGAWVIGTLIGINLIFDGWGLIGAAAAAKDVQKAVGESA